MKKSLSPRTVNKYVEYIGQIVASLKDGRTGEPIHPRKWDRSVMDLPIVNPRKQRRPTLRSEAVNKLVSNSHGDEQALYVLLAATGMRISQGLALETKHFVNGGRTIQVQQQVNRDKPRIVPYLKTDAGVREVDLSKEVAEYLQSFSSGKNGLLFKTRNVTPYLHNNLEQRWLTPRLQVMGLDEKGMVFTPSVASERHGCEQSGVRKTSTTSGWDISRRRCLNSTLEWSLNWNVVSMKRRRLA
jgi:integrase